MTSTRMKTPSFCAAAAYCLGEANKGTSIPGKAFESLKAGIKEQNADIYKACAEPLGKCQLSRDQVREVLVQQRVE